MCIAVPGRIIAINEPMAQVLIMGVEAEVNITFLEEVKVGEWVLVHTGYAMSKIDEDSAKASQAFLEKLGDY